MNEQQFGFKVRQNLNLGLHELRPETLARLAAAREKALSCQKQAETRSVLATIGGFVHFRTDHLRFRQTLSALALVVGLGIAAYWTADQRISELGAIDSALLTDEIPVRAFTDKGFAAWLTRDAQQ